MKRTKKLIAVFLAVMMIASVGLLAACVSRTNIPVVSISIVGGERMVALDAGGDLLQLDAAVYPANASNRRVAWASSNASVASVSLNGRLSLHTVGHAYIVATSESNPTASSTVRITVVPDSTYIIDVVSVTIQGGNRSLPRNATEGERRLTANVSPSDASNRVVSWTSSNTRVATINAGGVLTLHATGTANITARSVQNPEVVSNPITITVTAPVQGPQPTTISPENRRRIADAIASLIGLATNKFPEAVENAGVNAFINAIQRAGITNAQVNLVFDAIDDFDEGLLVWNDCCCGPDWGWYTFNTDFIQVILETLTDFGLTGTHLGTIAFELLNSALAIHNQYLGEIAEFISEYYYMSRARLQELTEEYVEMVQEVVNLGRARVIDAFSAAIQIQAQFGISDTLAEVIENMFVSGNGNGNPLLSLTREEFITVVTGLAGDLRAAVDLFTDDVLNTYVAISNIFVPWILRTVIGDDIRRVEEDKEWFERMFGLIPDWLIESYEWHRAAEAEIPQRAEMFRVAFQGAVADFGAVRNTVRAATNYMSRTWAGSLFDAVNATPQNQNEAVRLVGRVFGAAAAATGGLTPQLIATHGANLTVPFFWRDGRTLEYIETYERAHITNRIFSEVSQFFTRASAFNLIPNPGGPLPTNCWLTNEIRWVMFGYGTDECCCADWNTIGDHWSGIFGGSSGADRGGNLSSLSRSHISDNIDGREGSSIENYIWFGNWWQNGQIGRTHRIEIVFQIDFEDYCCCGPVVTQSADFYIYGTYVIDGSTMTIAVEDFLVESWWGSFGVNVDYIVAAISEDRLVLPIINWDGSMDVLAYAVFDRNFWWR